MYKIRIMNTQLELAKKPKDDLCTAAKCLKTKAHPLQGHTLGCERSSGGFYSLGVYIYIQN